MRLSKDFFAALRDRQGDSFDKEVAVILAKRHARVAEWTSDERIVWVKHKRRWLEHIGVTAQQHILDHLEIMIVNGNGVVDDTDYRAIMTRPFQSQEEKAVMLRRRFLTGGD